MLKWPFWFLIFPEKEAEEEGIWSWLERAPSEFLINNDSDGLLFFLWLFFFHKFKVNLVPLYVFNFYNCNWILVPAIKVKEIRIMICDYFLKKLFW